MARKSLFKYGSQQDYSADGFSRPANANSVSVVSHEVEFKGVNVVVEATLLNCEVGDMLLYDKQELKHKILKMRTYNAATFDTDRYVKSNAFMHHSVKDVGLFVHASRSTAAWGAQCEFVLKGFDLTQSGQFTFLSTGYQAKGTATTITWSANDTLDSIKAQFTTGNGGVIGSGSYSSVAIEEDSLVFMVGGTGTNLITIGSLTGGAENLTLIDYSKTCKIGETLVSDTDTHRSFQGSTVATCFPTIAGQLQPVTSASYTKAGVNRPYRCGMLFTKFKEYVSVSGSSTFVDDTTAGSVFPMTLAKFQACGISQDAAEKACYDRHKGNYDDYLKMAMADVENCKGTVGNAYENFGKQGKLLASIFYKNRKNEWKPCYPAAYAASQIAVTAAGFETGFEAGNFYQWDSFEGVSAYEQAPILNPFISAVGGTVLGTSYDWLSSEHSGSYAWLCSSGDGTLSGSNKMNSCGVRGAFAFKFNS